MAQSLKKKEKRKKRRDDNNVKQTLGSGLCCSLLSGFCPCDTQFSSLLRTQRYEAVPSGQKPIIILLYCSHLARRLESPCFQFFELPLYCGSRNFHNSRTHTKVEAGSLYRVNHFLCLVDVLLKSKYRVFLLYQSSVKNESFV